MTNSENIRLKLSNSISLKLVVILLLILLIQIPLSYVRGLINERQQMQYQAQREISSRWGKEQYIGPPILILYSKNDIPNNDKTDHNNNYLKTELIQSTVSSLDIKLDAEKRYLGIYEAAIYHAKVNLSGTIKNNIISLMQSDSLKLFIPIRQLKGLKKIEFITINGKQLDSIPQSKSFNKMTGIEIKLDKSFLNQSLNYEIELTLAGSGQFDILPLAKETIIELQSNWASPSFIGDTLPDNRKITEHGFIASWHINNLIQNFTKDKSNADNSTHNFILEQNLPSVGVKILIPANIYQVNERTVKYSFLIVLLSFAGFFLAELFFKLRLHPFQYLLIGVSLSVFYLLLLSLSEYLLFNLAFLISASSIILLIGSYCSVVLQQRNRGIFTSLLFAILYGFIFILVKAEQTSLLMGSIGIWLILALVMYLTRNIDWYKVSEPSIDKAL
jgi:inner membrane protein